MYKWFGRHIIHGYNVGPMWASHTDVISFNNNPTMKYIVRTIEKLS